jgi:hypothetical protein
MDFFSNEINKGCTVFIILVVVLCASIIIGDYYYKKNNHIIETKIELQKYNDSLKIKVDNLDSIKNAKVIEVKTLDDDSTVKLFYRLIRE